VISSDLGGVMLMGSIGVLRTRYDGRVETAQVGAVSLLVHKEIR